ncbi:MAG TPA: TIGR03084 family metal-binding protein [Acidimicrobiia bacterium]|jgi:uncharacterized protein (TIGR03084 family)
MAVSVADLLTDLDAETAVFDHWIVTLPDEEWTRPTPAAGWTIADQVSHLAYFDDAAVRSATDPDAFRAGLDAVVADVDGFTARIAAENRSKSPAELRAWFTRARADLGATYATIDPRTRLPWYGPDMSAASMATARIMETWAHGQDVADALRVAHPATAAVRHVAFLGVRTRDFSYATRGLDPPGVDVQVELTGPLGEVWTFGAGEAANTVRGPAVDFCLVVTRRRHVDDTALDVQGAHAAQWMSIAQAYAGPPGSGRSPHEA